MKSLISIVVPCYNEAGCLPAFLDRAQAILDRIPGIDYEILAINDGSTDQTASVLETMQTRSPRLGVIQFVRNFGHQAALSAGLSHARGDAVICMDADLQHPPELLPEMIGRWQQGFDIVQTVRRSQPGLAKSFSSRAFYSVLNLFSEVEITDGAADFRLMSRRAVDALMALPEHTRFIRGLVAWLGFPCATLQFDAPERHAGRSAYGIKKMFGMALDAMVTLSARPLHLALWIAAFVLVSAFVYAVYIIDLSAHGVALVRGWTSTILLILVMGSVNLLCTGILGLYLRAALVEVRKRPDYLISSYIPPGHRSFESATLHKTSDERDSQNFAVRKVQI
ncbi:MAG TPA: glycosyltransferase family 2 protein [Terriglobales bacterium]